MMTMEECMIVCRLEVAEHRSLLDKILLSENLTTTDKNAVSIARATITIYVPSLPYPSPPSTDDSFNTQTTSSSPSQSPPLHTPLQSTATAAATATATAAVQPTYRTEVNSYVQSCTRHTLPTSTIATDSSTDSTGSTSTSAAARRERDNSDGASVAHSVEPSHTVVDNNNNNNNNNDNDGNKQVKDNRELLRKIAENYRILNRRDVPKRPTNNHSIVSRRVMKRIVRTHKTADNVLPKNTPQDDDEMSTLNRNDVNTVSSSRLCVVIDRTRLGDRLNTLLDNRTMQPSTSTAVNNVNTISGHEETTRNSYDSSTSSTDRSIVSTSSLEQYLMNEYAKCQAKGECFDTFIMTRRQRELLQIQEDCSLMTDEEELPPVRHRRAPYRIKTRLSSKMKKKQALLATFRKATINEESVKVSPQHRATPSSSCSSSDNESSGVRSSWKKTSKPTAPSPVDTESSSSSDTADNHHSGTNETATAVQSENSEPATVAVEVKRKIRAISSETLARYLAHMKLKQRGNNLNDSGETTTTNNKKDEDTVNSIGDDVSVGGALNGQPLVTNGDVGCSGGGGAGDTVVIQCSTQTHTNSNSDSDNSYSVSGDKITTGEPVSETVQCSNSGGSSSGASPDTTTKITRIQRNGRRFFHHDTIGYIKPRKCAQLRKTFSASLINLVDKSIEISKQSGTSEMNKNSEPSVTRKLRNTRRKSKTPKRKVMNVSQDGSCSGQPIAEEVVHSASGAGSSGSSADTVSYKGYSIFNKLIVNNNNVQDNNGHKLDNVDNENNSPECRGTQSDNTPSDFECERGEVIHYTYEPYRYFTNVKYGSSNEDDDDDNTSASHLMNDDATVDKNNVTSNASAEQSNDGGEPCNTNAQPAPRDSSALNTAQPVDDGADESWKKSNDVRNIIITDVRSMATCSDDEASSPDNTGAVVSQTVQDSTGPSVILKHLLQPRQPSDPNSNEPRHSKPACAVTYGPVNKQTDFNTLPPLSNNSNSNNNNGNSTARSEPSQKQLKQPWNDKEKLTDINSRLHDAHQTSKSVPAKNGNGPQSAQQQQNQPLPPQQVQPKRTYTRRQPTRQQQQQQNTGNDEAMLLKHHYQQIQQLGQPQLLPVYHQRRSLPPPPPYPGVHEQQPPPAPAHSDTREMYELSPNGRNMIAIHQYQTGEPNTRVPVTSTAISSQPPSYRRTVNNMINPNIPRMSMAPTTQSMNSRIIPIPSPPPPLPPPTHPLALPVYPSIHPMLHSPTNPPHPHIPASHVNPQNTMLSTPTLPTNIGPLGSGYPIAIIPPSTQMSNSSSSSSTSRLAARRPGPVSDVELYTIRPMPVLENQQYTARVPRPPAPPSQQPARRASVQSPVKRVTQHTVQSMVQSTPQRPAQRCTVQSAIQQEAQSTARQVVTQHTVENVIHSPAASRVENVVQSPRQVAGRRLIVKAQIHQPPKHLAQRNHTPTPAPASSSTTTPERVKVEHLVYSPIEDIVNKIVQSPTIPQDSVQSPAIPADRVQSPTSAANVNVQSVTAAKVMSSSGTKVVRLVQPATQVTVKNVVQSSPEDTVEKSSKVKTRVAVHSPPARQEPDVHSATPVEDKRAPVPATKEPDDENVEHHQHQVTAATVSMVTLTASDSYTITSEAVNSNVARPASTVCNTSANVEQSQENTGNNDVVIPATVTHVDTPRARPRIRNNNRARVRVRRYWETRAAVRLSRTVRVRRLVLRQMYRRRRMNRKTSVTPGTTQQDTTTTDNDITVKCESENEQAIEITSVTNIELVPSTSTADNADPRCVQQTPDRMNVPVNFYTQTDEQPVYASTVISQGVEALQLAQMYIETFQNNHDTMRDLQQALRELIVNVNMNNGKHADSRISHTEQLLKQFLYNQRNIRTEFVIRQEVVSSNSDNGTQQTDNSRTIFTVERLQESLEKLAVLLTQLRDSVPGVVSEPVQQTEEPSTSDEQPSTEQRDTINNDSSVRDEPVVNVQLPWSRARNTVVDNTQPSTSSAVSTGNHQTSDGEQVITTPSAQDDVNYQYALDKLKERKLDNNKCTPPSAVNKREENKIVTELLNNGARMKYSILVQTAANQSVMSDGVNNNVPSVSQVLPTSDVTSANNTNTQEMSTEEVHVDTPPPPPMTTTSDIPSHHNTTSGSASGIIGPRCQLCCSVDKHEEAKRKAQNISTATTNEQSTLLTANQEQLQQQQQQPMLQAIERTLLTANQEHQQQRTSQLIEPTLITANQQQQQPMLQAIERILLTANQEQQQQRTSQPTEPTLITANRQQQQPMLQPIERTLLTANQEQQQQRTSQPTEPTLITANHKQPQQRTPQPTEPILIIANQQQPMLQSIEQQQQQPTLQPKAATLITVNQVQQQQQQQPTSQPTEPTLLTVYRQQPMAQSPELSVRETRVISTYRGPPIELTEHLHIPCTIDIPPAVLATNNGRVEIFMPPATLQITSPQTLTTPPEVQPAIERADNTSHLPSQSTTVVHVLEDLVTAVMPSPSTSHTHLPVPPVTSEQRPSDGECSLSSPPCKIEANQNAGTSSSASTSHSNKRHLADTLSAGDGSKRARLDPSTSDTSTPAAAAATAPAPVAAAPVAAEAATTVTVQPVPPADFIAAVNQRLDNTNSLIMSLLKKKKERKRTTGTAAVTDVRDDEVVSQSSVATTSLYSCSERMPSRSTSYIHRPPETQHYNPNETPLSHHHQQRQRPRHHTPRLPSYNVPTYQSFIYSDQHTVRPQVYLTEDYVRHRDVRAPFQQPVLRPPSRYVAYPVVAHPGLPSSVSAPLQSQVQQAEYPLTMLTSMVNEHPHMSQDRVRRRSEPLPQYIQPLPCTGANMNLIMTSSPPMMPPPPPPPPPPSSRPVRNHHEYRSRRNSHRSNASTSSTVRPNSAQPHQELFSQFINYLNINNNNNNGTDSDTTMYPVVQMPPFPVEVLHGKQYNTLLCKYYQEPNEHSLMKYTINYKSKHTKTKWYNQRTDNNNNHNHNIITCIRDKNTVAEDHVQAKRYPYPFDHLHRKRLPSQIHENNSTRATQSVSNSKKRSVPGNCDNKTNHAHDTTQSVVVVVETSTQKNRQQPVSEHNGGAKHAIEMAAARLQVKELNCFIENNRCMLLQNNEPGIRPDTLRAYAVTDVQEIHRLFDTVTLTDSVQYYRSLWCMWCVAKNKHLYEFYRTVTQLQIRADQTPFAIRIFIELLRCKYLTIVRKLAEDQYKR